MTTSATVPLFPWMMTPEQAQRRWEEFVRKSANLPRVMEVARRVRTGATPSEAVFQLDSLRLLRFNGQVDRALRTPLLVVFALVNRPYILDLRKGRSVVSHFVDRGIDTFKIDWGVPAPSQRYLGMDDYINRYTDEAVEQVRARTGADKVSILGYCMGGTMSAMYTALHPEKVANLILLAAPVDWSNQDHLLARWTGADVFDVDKLIDVYGNAPAEMLQGAFLLLKPVTNLVEKYLTFYENMDNEKFLEDFFAMETWLNDNIPVAGEMFRQFVKHCMQRNELIQGRLNIGGKAVRLADIRCPVLNLVAEKDHLVPCGQSLPFNEAVGSRDRTVMRFSAGHIGLAVGSRAHGELWPKVCEWLAERSG